MNLKVELLKQLQQYERSDGGNILIYAPFDGTPKDGPIVNVAGFGPDEIHRGLVSLRHNGAIENSLSFDGATQTGIYFTRLTNAGRRLLARPT
jgi:hypothetical protein